MKTILITSFHPLISRNIVGTRIIDTLLESGCRVVVVVPDYKKEFFEKTHSREGQVEIAGVDVTAGKNRAVRIIKKVAEALPNTKRAYEGRKRTLLGKFKNPLVYWLVYVPVGLLGCFKLTHYIFRLVSNWLTPRGHFDALFEKFKPDLVFLSDIQNENDVSVMLAGRARGVKIVGMVRSWDNLTTRALRFVPKKIIVHNEIIKEEAVSLYGIKRNSIVVAGIAHYDRYLQGPNRTRGDFFASLGLDERKKTVLYIPMCDYRLANNSVDSFILYILAKKNINVIVRFPPAAEVTVSNFNPPKNVFFDRPGVDFGRGIGGRDLTPEDDERFIEELAYCDVVVGGPSTVIIDAALFDKPILLVDFYPAPLSEDERIYEYRVEHIENILRTEGVVIARSVEEFGNVIAAYFMNPKLYEEGRRRIVKEQAQFIDGRSCERVVEAIGEALPE